MTATPATFDAGRPLKVLHVLRAPVGGLFRHVVDLASGQVARGHRVGIVADAVTGGAGAAALATLA
jgi:predicted deacylase